MHNLYLYYKYVIRSQFLLKYPTKLASNLMKNVFKKLQFKNATILATSTGGKVCDGIAGVALNML